MTRATARVRIGSENGQLNGGDGLRRAQCRVHELIHPRPPSLLCLHSESSLLSCACVSDTLSKSYVACLYRFVKWFTLKNVHVAWLPPPTICDLLRDIQVRMTGLPKQWGWSL